MWWDKSGNKWGMDREWGICHTQHKTAQQGHHYLRFSIEALLWRHKYWVFMDPIRSGPPGACPVSLLKSKYQVYT